MRTPRLTGAAMETLAVIAYRQPVGRAEIEEIRGVSAGGVLRSLQERGLIEVVGRSEAMGRPLLYGTTPLFLELLGLRDLGDLPRTEEFSVALQPPQAGDRRLRRGGRLGAGRIMSEMRLQRALARAGIASRRAAEELIEAGRVRVDGKVADAGQEGGSRPAADHRQRAGDPEAGAAVAGLPQAAGGGDHGRATRRAAAPCSISSGTPAASPTWAGSTS